MNSKFFDLPQEKQNIIINAALHVFAKYDYKKASTDEIASLAGISKGLIFHYFGSKKELYLFVYKYSEKYISSEMVKLHNYKETDFFKILTDVQMCKAAIREKYPDIMNFMVQVCYEENEDVKDEIDSNLGVIIARSGKGFMDRADRSKFKDDISPEKVMNIILWFSDGYMRSKEREWQGNLIELNNEFMSYIEFIRKLVYKPEYL